VLLGDLAELHASWRHSLGAGRAERRLAVEVAASLPAILRLSLSEGRLAGWVRSLVALVGGLLVCLIPVGVGGSAVAPRAPVLARVLLTVAAGFAGGWLAAAAGGSYPRRRAALVAAALVACGLATSAGLTPFLILACAATLGGESYTRRSSS
jgi:hypothetical protein